MVPNIVLMHLHNVHHTLKKNRAKVQLFWKIRKRDGYFHLFIPITIVAIIPLRNLTLFSRHFAFFLCSLRASTEHLRTACNPATLNAKTGLRNNNLLMLVFLH